MVLIEEIVKYVGEAVSFASSVVIITEVLVQVVVLATSSITLRVMMTDRPVNRVVDVTLMLLLEVMSFMFFNQEIADALQVFSLVEKIQTGSKALKDHVNDVLT